MAAALASDVLMAGATTEGTPRLTDVQVAYIYSPGTATWWAWLPRGPFQSI
jgi:hypothetical protein